MNWSQETCLIDITVLTYARWGGDIDYVIILPAKGWDFLLAEQAPYPVAKELLFLAKGFPVDSAPWGSIAHTFHSFSGSRSGGGLWNTV